MPLFFWTTLYEMQSQVKGPVDQYNPYNYDESFAQEYGGFGEGGVLVGMGGMRNAGPRGPERELKIPTLVRDVPRPLSPPRHRYRAGSYERDMPPPSLMGVGQPVRGPGYVAHDTLQRLISIHFFLTSFCPP